MEKMGVWKKRKNLKVYFQYDSQSIDRNLGRKTNVKNSTGMYFDIVVKSYVTHQRTYLFKKYKSVGVR